MKPDDAVTAIYMPQLGVGVVQWSSPDGRLVVSFEVDGKPYSDEFSPFELQLVPVPARAA